MSVVNTYCPGVPDLGRTGASFMAVLTQGQRGDYKVYTGLVKLPAPEAEAYKVERERAALVVAALGRPVRFEEAVCYFPSIPAVQYRT